MYSLRDNPAIAVGKRRDAPSKVASCPLGPIHQRVPPRQERNARDAVDGQLYMWSRVRFRPDFRQTQAGEGKTVAEVVIVLRVGQQLKQLRRLLELTCHQHNHLLPARIPCLPVHECADSDRASRLGGHHYGIVPSLPIGQPRKVTGGEILLESQVQEEEW